ncbi:MAG: RagB/SusD family nutrient uptake outer membrane protein, partial [Dysgonamonadaceae bacterium]|nr:RagB/SusD family nutrient uptake outer membrane protein [Dysgonamonadaceae bacterium]
ADGLPIKETSFLPQSPDYDASESGFGTLTGTFGGFEVSNIYIGREPRFYNTVTFSGKKWQVSGKEVQFYYLGNADKRIPDGAPVTGYLLFKRHNRTIHGVENTITSKFHPSIIFRLADFYLLYAEVLNEVEPGNPDVLKYVNLVRERAGLPKLEVLNPAIAGNPDLQREAIRRERRIELATEGQRYFDVRRWMIAEKAPGEGGQGGEFTGMNPDGGKYTGFHTRKKIPYPRSFKRKNYLFPISLEDMQRSKVLVQNPGW